MAQSLRAVADGTITGFTTLLGSGSNLFAAIDELVADPADGIQSGPAPANLIGRWQLDPTGIDPGIDTGMVWSIMCGKDTSGGATLTTEQRIYVGSSGTPLSGTLIATFNSARSGGTAFANVPFGQTVYSFPLTSGEAALVRANLPALWFEIWANQP